MINKRINNLSLLRLIATLLIILFHILMVLCPGEGNKFIPLNFAVLIFFFMSGFLYQKIQINSIKEYYKKQALKIFIPVLLLCLCYYILCIFVNFNFINPITNIKCNFEAFGHLWFIPVIFLCYLLLPLLNIAFDPSHRYNKLAKILLICLFVIELITFFFFDVQTGLAIFEIGFFTNKFNILEKLKKKKNSSIVLAISIFLVSVVLYYVSKNLFPCNSFIFIITGNFLQRLFSCMLGLSCSIFILLGFEFLNIKQSKIWSISDKYSFYIYLTHQPFLIGALSLINLTKSLTINIIIFLATTTLASVVLCKLTETVIKIIKNTNNNINKIKWTT